MASGLLSAEQVANDQLMFLSCYKLYNRIFSNARRQMQAVLKKLSGLHEPPNLEDDIRLHINKQKMSMDTLLATPGLTTKIDLGEHIQVMSAAAFIHMAVCAKHLDEQLTTVYAMIEDMVVTKIKELPGALTLKDLAY